MTTETTERKYLPETDNAWEIRVFPLAPEHKVTICEYEVYSGDGRYDWACECGREDRRDIGYRSIEAAEEAATEAHEADDDDWLVDNDWDAR